jgi:hypothetical protein
MSTITDIADAVVTGLNAGTFSQEFTAQRSYRPVMDLPQLQALHVTVVPRDVTIASAGRDRNQHDCRIDIAVQKKVDQEQPAEIDSLMDLVEEIIECFQGHRLDDYPDAALVRIENAPIYSVEHMDQHQVFTSVVTLTYRMWRQL